MTPEMREPRTNEKESTELQIQLMKLINVR